MVVESKRTISPQLLSRLADYSKSNEVHISKSAVEAALKYLEEHTSLPLEEREEVIEKAIGAVHLKGRTYRNYEGDEALDPKSFGREVVLVCTENGIKIKRVPKSVMSEAKDKYEGVDEGVLDNSYVIMNMQPDLCPESKKIIITETLNDVLSDSDGYEGGHVNYEYFGKKLKENIGHARKAKAAEKAVDHIMDIFTGDDSYEGAGEDAFEYYDGIYNFTEDDFEDYYEGLSELLSDSDSYEGDGETHDNLFKKLKAKVAAKKQVRQANKAVKQEARAERKTAKIQNKIDRKSARQEARFDKKAARKEKRAERGSTFGNILTGGVAGAAKKAKNKRNAKKEAKKAAKEAQAGIDQAAQSSVDQAPSDVTAVGVAVSNQTAPADAEWKGDATAAQAPAADMSGSAEAQPQPSGGGGGGGGDSGGAPEMSQPEEEEETPEENQEQEELPEDNSTEGDDEIVIEEEDDDLESNLDQDSKDVYTQEDSNEMGNYTGNSKGWFPSNEDDPEIASFFGFSGPKQYRKRSHVRKHEADGFLGMEEVDNKKIIFAVLLAGVAIWAYMKFRKA